MPHAINAKGICPTARCIASPNKSKRPEGLAISLIVIHYISLPPHCFVGDDVIDFFTNQLDISKDTSYQAIANVKVSAHFFIRRNGELIQFVSCLEQAWHAGVSAWQGRERCNEFSIGIELEGDELTLFTESQYQMLIDLIQGLKIQYPISDIVGHLDIALPAGRKIDPGPFFDWGRIKGFRGGCF